VSDFKDAAKVALKNKKNEWNGVSESAKCLIACSDALVHVVDTEPISHFIGKVCAVYLSREKIMFFVDLLYSRWYMMIC
jgi:hypothetical protein